MAEVIEYLSSKCEALRSMPTTNKIKSEKKEDRYIFLLFLLSPSSHLLMY
jgi:hypothetical protein